MKTAKGKVACTAFPDQSVKTSAVGTGAIKVGLIENRASLAKLTVVLDTEDGRFREGDFVFVPSKQYTAGWGKEVLTLGEKSFILVPEDQVMAFERFAPVQTSILGEK
jgi:hypothetical protein